MADLLARNYELQSCMTTFGEMLAARGCTLVESARSLDELRSLSQRNEPVVRGTDPHIHVFFVAEASVSVKVLRQIMEASVADTVLVCSEQGPTPFTRREAEASFGMRVQFFTHREASVNVTKHCLVPKHSLEPADAHAPADAAHYPRMLRTDPVARFYGFAPGDVVRIERSRMHAIDVVYRLVVTT